jgi:hypothetical protein
MVAERPTGFSIERIEKVISISPEYKQLKGVIYTYLVHFEGAFADALKTQAQEALGSEADRGTILALTISDLPTGCTVFTTETNVDSHGDNPTRYEHRAAAVITDAAAGIALPMSVGNEVTWAVKNNSFAKYVGMFIISNGLAAWEVIRPVPSHTSRITFGVAFLIPPVASLPHTTVLAGGLGPFYSASAATLPAPARAFPLPRFAPAANAVTILFEAEPSANAPTLP